MTFLINFCIFIMINCPFCSDEFSQSNLPRKIPKCRHSICTNCFFSFQKTPKKSQMKCKICKLPVNLNYYEINLQKSFAIDFKICKKLKLRIDDLLFCQTHNRKCTHFCVGSDCSFKIGCLQCSKTLHQLCFSKLLNIFGSKYIEFTGGKTGKTINFLSMNNSTNNSN